MALLCTVINIMPNKKGVPIRGRWKGRDEILLECGAPAWLFQDRGVCSGSVVPQNHLCEVLISTFLERLDIKGSGRFE